MKRNHGCRVREIVLALGLMALQGCSTHGIDPENARDLRRVDRESLEAIQENLVEESAKLLEQQEALHNRMSRAGEEEPVPPPEEPEYDPLESISVTIDVANEDVQNVLRALADQAGMSVLLDPELADLNRRISMYLADVPASLVFTRIMQLLDLHGEVDNNVLVVRPFKEKVFQLDFLDNATTMDLNMGGDVFGANSMSSAGGGAGGGGGGSGGSGGGGQSAMTGSLSLVGVNSETSDPYSRLEEMLDSLLRRRADVQSGEQGLPGLARTGLGGENREREGTGQGASSVYSLNPMTGTLYVRARPSLVDTVSDLISRYRDVLQRQVLIEAQILDVSLSEQFAFGIDWTLLRDSIVTAYGTEDLTLGGQATQLPGSDAASRVVTLPGLSAGGEDSFGALYSNMTFSAALNMLHNFGTVRVLSNPSIRAKNSRPAFISVGRTSRYIAESTAVTNAVGGGDSTTSTSVTTSSVFNGIMLGVHPFIAEDGKINLTIHPMQSEVQEESLQLVDVGGSSKVSLPVIDFKGLTTSLSLTSGDTIILGGLIDEVGGNSGDGLPGLRGLQGVGRLFGNTREYQRARELVIVLRVTAL